MLFCDLCGSLIIPDKLKIGNKGLIYCSEKCREKGEKINLGQFKKRMEQEGIEKSPQDVLISCYVDLINQKIVLPPDTEKTHREASIASL